MRVRYFAAAADAAGTHEVEAPDAATVGALVELLGAGEPRLAAVLAVCSFLVDGRRARAADPLPQGATVDVLPPFAGG